MIIGKYRVNMDDSTLCRCGFSKEEIEAKIDKCINSTVFSDILLKKECHDGYSLMLQIPVSSISVLKDFNPNDWNDIGVSIPKEYWGKPLVLKTKCDYTMYPDFGYELCAGYISPHSGKIRSFSVCDMRKYMYFKLLESV